MIRSTTMSLAGLRLADETFRNPRTHTGLALPDIRELALDILRRGLLMPLLVTSDGLVIAGQRRYRALELLSRWRDDDTLLEELPGPLTQTYCEEVNLRVVGLTDEVPVRVIWEARNGFDPEERDTQLEGIALADNLLRSDLSGYEVGARLSELHAQGVTGVQLARLIGKSTSYVSRKLAAWRNAGPELLEAWRDGMSDDGVEELGKLSLEGQAKALAGPVPRGRRGPAHRPSVDAVRDFLLELEQRETPAGLQLAVGREAREFAYLAGVIDALRWATGVRASAEFARLASDNQVTGDGT